MPVHADRPTLRHPTPPNATSHDPHPPTPERLHARTQAVVAAPEAARSSGQQIVETEHLLKALMEQPNGLARRVVAKAGADATALLAATDALVRRQPRISGDAANQQVGGPALSCG
eukprot:354968-Chlamydomonas_euryale.AAC.5